MEPERADKIENLITLYNQICLYVTMIVIYIMIRLIRKKQSTHCTNIDFIYNTDCPICFNGFIVPIKSNCGHAFCLDCLYTYWKKPSWNNMCPLCRTKILNLKPIEKEGLSNKWTPEVLEKIKRIISKKSFYRLSIANNRSTIYSCFFCAVFLVLWTYAVSNLNKIMYYIFSIYNSLYDIKTEINV